MAQAPERESMAGGTGSTSYETEIAIERKLTGKPHKGKMLAAIQPHCDDIPIFAGGTVLKLIDEGYEGILITLSNDSMAGEGNSIGDIVLKNENDTKEVARAAWAEGGAVPQLSQSQYGRLAVDRDSCAARLSVPRVQGGYRFRV